jgi:recombinational DNA repair protein (RecF pathway)
MGYALATSHCYGCGRLFSYNPVRVPSLPAAVTKTGTKEPVCLNCVTAANPRRIANGLAPIVPHPEAYSACDESELL